MDYREFLKRKQQLGGEFGFDPIWMPDRLFDFQKHIVEWALRKGRGAILADTGLGKTFQQLTWSHNVLLKTNKPVLILTPLAVAHQTAREGEKFGIDCEVSKDGRHSGGIVITNYERLHYFNPDDFVGVVCDESSILKSFSGQRQKQITRFMAKTPYRLLCTATAAPNDYIELGTSSGALGELSYSEMLRRFFRQLDDKGQKAEAKKQQDAEAFVERDPNYYKKLAFRISQTIGQYRLKHHAVDQFWRWVASWAIACRMPSDLGFSDDGFVLPPLQEVSHVIKPKSPPPGMLFTMPAVGMSEERSERKRTIKERCEFVANLVDHKESAVIWCHTNDEADLLEEIIPDAVQVAGRTPDDKKVEIYESFSGGSLRVIVIKPKIGAFGLNWQHCSHVVTFPTHSYEQYYQSVRRCYRYGQTKPVRLDIVATEGEVRVIGNMQKKADKATKMFEMLVSKMNEATRIERQNYHINKMEHPSWL